MDYSIKLPNASNKHVDINGMIEVNDQTEDDSLCENVCTIAKYFVKELDYGRPVYDKIHTKSYNAFLFTEVDIELKAEKKEDYLTVYGACLFQKTNLIREHGEMSVLKWVWIHPFFRNRKKFHPLWEVFEEKYGDFYIAEPVSSAMQEFLKGSKKEDFEHHQLDLP